MQRFGGALLLFMGLASAILAGSFAPAVAADISLDDRMERWRAARAGRLQLPLPGTPDTEKPLTRLASTGVTLGAPMMIRIFKAESEFEIWVLRDKVYVPFATYPVCYWAGNLGPKLREGDRQTPEGFYTLTENQLHDGTRWRRSLDIGFPNVFDRVNGRSGSAILVHGGCDSSGCFAMTNPVSTELYDLVSATLRSGTQHIPVHVFPFRMTDANMTKYKAGPWSEFWDDLKQGYDSFERTHLPPHVSVCGKRYHIHDAMRGGRDAEGVEICDQDRDTIPDHLEQIRPDDQTTEAQTQARAEAAPPPPPPCEMARASCRKWVSLHERRAASRTFARHNTTPSKRSAVR